MECVRVSMMNTPINLSIEMECKVFPGFALPSAFFIIFTEFENARRTYSCEYF